MREYKNFKEVERDLKLLKLQQEIDKEKAILSLNRTKESISPKNVLKSAAGSLLKNALIFKATTKVLGFIGDKFK